MTDYDVVIVGGGAAGLMCAAQAGKRGRRVLVIEKSKSVGEKIRISSGGRCNFTNLHAAPANYLSENAHFCVSALRRYTQQDFIALVEAYGIAYHEKTLGQLFCDGSSKQIIQMLLDECAAGEVDIRTQAEVEKVAQQGVGFTVTLGDGKKITTASLVIATGGPSIPKMGATGWGYAIARQFGLKVIEPRAALVPFTLDETQMERLRPLAGIAVDGEAACGKTQFCEGILFTHRGLSGPAILQISSYWREGEPVTLNLLPDHDLANYLQTQRTHNPKQEAATALAALLPKKLAAFLCEAAGVQGRLADCSNAALQKLADQVQRWAIIPSGTEGYRTAEVTLGGVDTAALSSKTMEAKAVPGLYFIGEVVDVTGWLGGFNFQWAWASGHACGQYV